MKRKYDSSSEETQRKCVADVIARVEEIDGAEVGVIAAQDIIDIVTQHLGPEIYNSGLDDARKLIKERVADIETELDLLQQSA